MTSELQFFWELVITQLSRLKKMTSIKVGATQMFSQAFFVSRFKNQSCRRETACVLAQMFIVVIVFIVCGTVVTFLSDNLQTLSSSPVPTRTEKSYEI